MLGIWLCLGALYCFALQPGVLAQLRHPTIQSLVGASTCALTLLWQIDAQLPGWPPIHFLGLTTLVLLLGLRLGLLTLAMPVLLQLAWMYVSTDAVPLDADFELRWALLALTAVATYAIYLGCDRFLPHHFFTTIFAGGFLNAMATACLYYGVSFAMFRDESSPIDTDWFLLPLIALPEALLNGMALTLLVVYRPQWVAALRMQIFER